MQALQRLKRILLDDELKICADLEREMNELVGTYFDEWKTVVEDQERQKQFRQFVNTVSFGCISLESFSHVSVDRKDIHYRTYR